MAISNNTTGLRPGVCLSTTRPTAPYEGQMIYETDTNRVLVYEGAAWVMIADTDTPPAMQLIVPVAHTNCSVNSAGIVSFSGVSSFIIKSAFSSDFNNYRFFITTARTADTSDVSLNVRFAKNGSVQANASDYSYVSEQRYTTVQSNNGSNATDNIPIGRFSNNKSTYSGNVHFPADNTVYSSVVSEGINIQNGLTSDANTCRGFVRVLDSYDGLQFFASGGINMTGTMQIYGYR